MQLLLRNRGAVSANQLAGSLSVSRRTIYRDIQTLKAVLILELAREHGRITVAEAARVAGASRNTVKDHLKALVERGHLTLHGADRGAWYGLI